MTAVPEQAKQLESHESPMTKLNVLQRQMLVESGIDFYGERHLAPICIRRLKRHHPQWLLPLSEYRHAGYES